MKTIIAGSRSIKDYGLVMACLEGCPWEITEVVSGEALGVDKLGEQWAEERGIPIKRFPVSSEEWEAYGDNAGHRRNARMAGYADALFAIWQGESGGTGDMITTARRLGLRVEVVLT